MSCAPTGDGQTEGGAGSRRAAAVQHIVRLDAPPANWLISGGTLQVADPALRKASILATSSSFAARDYAGLIENWLHDFNPFCNLVHMENYCPSPTPPHEGRRLDSEQMVTLPLRERGQGLCCYHKLTPNFAACFLNSSLPITRRCTSSGPSAKPQHAGVGVQRGQREIFRQAGTAASASPRRSPGSPCSGATTLICEISLIAPLTPTVSIIHAAFSVSGRACSIAMPGVGDPIDITRQVWQYLPNATRSSSSVCTSVPARIRQRRRWHACSGWMRPGPNGPGRFSKHAPGPAINADSGRRTLVKADFTVAVRRSSACRIPATCARFYPGVSAAPVPSNVVCVCRQSGQSGP